MLLVAEGDRASDRVVDRNVITSQLEAVAIAIGGCRAIAQVAIVVGNTILDGDGADWASIGFGEQVPAIVDVVVSDATRKTLPGPVVSLQANPSASSPLSGSKLSKEVQLRIRLLAGHSLCGALDE